VAATTATPTRASTRIAPGRRHLSIRMPTPAVPRTRVAFTSTVCPYEVCMSPTQLLISWLARTRPSATDPAKPANATGRARPTIAATAVRRGPNQAAASAIIDPTQAPANAR
jgi:hypothetical protein